MQEPLIPASTTLPEFTVKSFILSVILAIVLSASNAYLALKIGTTISASIPASVLALGILRFFRNSNVLESNMVQTAASAGEGVAGAISFVLPAMIFLHIWQGFPYWNTVIITLLGGWLGVFFSIPLRRVMLNLKTLRFPEGTAIGNVLKASVEGGRQLKYIIQGGVLGAVVTFAQTGLRVLVDNIQLWAFTPKSIVGIAFGFNPATLASGYIVGFEVAMSLLTGTVIGWIILIPIIALMYGAPHTGSAYDAVSSLWSNHLRFVGVGTMLVGGVWTLFRLLKPIASGLRLSFSSLRRGDSNQKEAVLRTERDVPIVWVILGSLILICLLFAFTFFYLHREPLELGASTLWLVTLLTILYVIVIGFILATIAAYFAGLIGSTNNPISGLLIISILLLAFIYFLIFRAEIKEQAEYIASTVIVVATVLAGIAAISNDNIQDLKAGYMVGATPWRQQLMMAIGVGVSAFIIGPVLDLLFQAYGMGGVYPRPGMDPTQMLAAPQSGLMAAVARGVLTQHLESNMIIIGGVVAVVVIILDTILSRKNFRLPALAVGVGIYLPPEIIMPIVFGGVLSLLVRKPWNRSRRTEKQEQELHQRQRSGVLMACGMVAGGALTGVILAIPFVIEGSANALSVVSSGFLPYANVLGVLVFLVLCYRFYAVGRSRKS